ncbi:hypothetical protein K3152_01305 [Qipengyuania sp. 1NDH17]|uniref:Uncharacterized protein n=1 Tax=Qipengyuania polymorpha TaxID=2867234 RepID=A0ABS7IU25_9SPHN|nr:hypothetical protein [Qipengyuania polymorpha]MBX7456874.1 hypothetical protein [Qipengyuania polymorpha]
MMRAIRARMGRLTAVSCLLLASVQFAILSCDISVPVLSDSMGPCVWIGPKGCLV